MGQEGSRASIQREGRNGEKRGKGYENVHERSTRATDNACNGCMQSGPQVTNAVSRSTCGRINARLSSN